MNIKELLKMVNNTNKLRKLLNEKEIIIEVKFNTYYHYKVKNYTEYKKVVKNEINEDFMEEYLNPELMQDEKYSNYFYTENLEIALIY